MYETNYLKFQDEVNLVIGSYLFWKIILKRSYEDEDILRGQNLTPLSWKLIRHSLQLNVFLTLGRIFDQDNDAFSADDLLLSCISEIDIFSRESIRRRKIESNNNTEPAWLNKYMESVSQPTEQDFQKLRGELSIRRRVFEKTYRPIRHKVFAHTDKEHIDQKNELWANTNMGELESLIWFLEDLRNSLFDSYHNGKELVLQGHEPNFRFFEKDFYKLMEMVKEFV